VVSPGEGFVTQSAKIDDFGHVSLGGVGQLIADLIEKKTGIETRWVVLGHIQRGGAPSAYDRVLGTRLGVAAGRLVLQRKFGRMVALQGTRVIDVPLADAVGKLKTLDEEFLRDAAEFFT
jgi:6-phosphofructokinase 1